jgi:hypothetical protein
VEPRRHAAARRDGHGPEGEAVSDRLVRRDVRVMATLLSSAKQHSEIKLIHADPLSAGPDSQTGY